MMISSVERTRRAKQEGHKGRSLGFAWAEIMNDPGESTFIQREAAEAGLDVIQCGVGREEASALASAYACNEFLDKGKEERSNC